MGSPITIAVNKIGEGRYRAEVVGTPPGDTFEAGSLKELFDRLEAPVSEVLELSDEDRDDIAAARAGLAEIAEKGAIPWETISSDRERFTNEWHTQ